MVTIIWQHRWGEICFVLKNKIIYYDFGIFTIFIYHQTGLFQGIDIMIDYCLKIFQGKSCGYTKKIKQ